MPELVRSLLLTVAVDVPDMSRLTAVRAQLMVLPSTVSATPPPSNQTARPQLAEPNMLCCVPENRLSVIATEPLAIGDT